MKCGFSTEFSTVRSPNRVLTTLKSASFEIRILSFVHHSQTIGGAIATTGATQC